MELTSSTLDKFPASDDLETKSTGFDGTNDFPTSKKLANLKNGTTSRASSSDRSSPATSVKPTSNKKSGSTATKKGTAKKPAVKKRKANDADADSVDGGRSNTPASRASKGPGKKQDSVSIAGSPAPEEKKKKKKGGRKRAEEDEDDFEDPNEVFCICRRPDNHTWMIGCDGDCEDWYHGKCVNIDLRDEDLIERYICKFCPSIFDYREVTLTGKFQVQTVNKVDKVAQLGSQCVASPNVVNQHALLRKTPANIVLITMAKNSCVSKLVDSTMDLAKEE